MAGFYTSNLQSLCQRRGWPDPIYECQQDGSGHSCVVLVNDHDYQTELTYESNDLAKEHAAMLAWWKASEQSDSDESCRRHSLSSVSKTHGTRGTKMSISASSDDSGYGSVWSDPMLEDDKITQRPGAAVEEKDLDGIITPFLESLTDSSRRSFEWSEPSNPSSSEEINHS
ncbi:hypothetical protein BJ166DRAFT_576331 [Pestalotiopsis sp. NC0098]|nr:hypothetical protein BJ166DRAFT_576331 [Pestalotiopsis sp. NC0098]